MLDIKPFSQSPGMTLAEISLAVYLGPQADSTLVFSSLSGYEKQSSEQEEQTAPVLEPISFSSQRVQQSLLPRPAKAEARLTITGVWFGKVPKLMVNKKMVSEGQSVDGWLLEKIDVAASRAFFSRNGTKRELTF
jgi:hypothetical protein